MDLKFCSITRFCITALLWLAVWPLFGQHPILEGFTARQTGETMRIDFAIKGGASCNGVILERSEDGKSEFTPVDQIPGVCGGSEFTEFYVMHDASPLWSQLNYYRLILGTQGFSDTLSVLFVPPNGSMQAYPIPFNTTLQLQWEGAENEEWLIQWFGADGTEVFSEQPVRAPRVQLALPDLAPGIYVVVLRHPVDGRRLQLRVLKANLAP